MIALRPYNTFGVAAYAERLVELPTTEAFLAYAQALQEHPRPYLLLGGGANLLFIKDFAGDILHPTNTDLTLEKEQSDSILVRVGAGYSWDDFVAWTTEQGLWGAELLSGIPGAVGASPVQNLGAYGAEAADIIARVEAVDLTTARFTSFSPEDLELGYRTSRFKRDWKGRYAIHHVTFRLSRQVPDDRANYARLGLTDTVLTPLMVRNKVLEVRAEKLPSVRDLGSAGSFFKNPVVSTECLQQLQLRYPDIPHYATDTPTACKLSAGWLIDQCGWKGYREGAVGVYARQALVLVNYGGAKGRDILALSERIVADVFTKMGVALEREVEVVD